MGDRARSAINEKPTYRVWCKADSNFSLAIRDGDVILARNNPSDDAQHWVKDETYCDTVRDEKGYRSFALINKATCESLKHAMDESYPLQLKAYNPDEMDYATLWTQSEDFGEGFTTIRQVNNIRLNMDGYHGHKGGDGITDGTTIVLWEFNLGDNQLWKIERY